MKRIELQISKELLDKIEAHHSEINETLKRFAKKEADKIRSGLWGDYQRVLLEGWRREYKPRRRIRIVMDHPPYMGGGIITTLHAGRKRK